MSLTFTRDEEMNKLVNITIISNASLATEYDLKSRGGALIWIGRNLFHGFSKKLSFVCESSAEAELDAINTAEKLGLLLKLKLLKITNNNIEVKRKLIADSKPAMVKSRLY